MKMEIVWELSIVTEEKCKHVWGRIGVISFHRKNFCLASSCHKCDKKKTIRKLEYKTLAGQSALILDDEVHKMLDLIGKIKVVSK